jgi:hypothetical protein
MRLSFSRCRLTIAPGKCEPDSISKKKDVATVKRFMTGLCGLCMFALVGCGNGQPGGPGATGDQSKQSTVTRTDETFTLDVPMMATKIKQGETKTFSVAIKRGKNLDEDVTLTFSDVPTGVTLEPMQPMIARADKEVKITATATNDAALGDFTVHVTGKPTKGADATNTMKLTVDKK